MLKLKRIVSISSLLFRRFSDLRALCFSDEGRFVRCVEVERKRGIEQVVGIKTFLKGDVQVSQFCKEKGDALIGTYLEGKSLFYQVLIFPFHGKKKIAKAIPYQTSISDQSSQENDSFYQILFSKEKETWVRVFSYSLRAIESKKKNLFMGIEPDHIGMEHQNLEGFLRWKDIKAVDLILDISSDYTSVFFVKRGYIVKSFYIDIGAEHLTDFVDKYKMGMVKETELKKLSLQVKRIVEAHKVLIEKDGPLNSLFIGYASDQKVINACQPFLLESMALSQEEAYYAKGIGGGFDLLLQSPEGIELLSTAESSKMWFGRLSKEFQTIFLFFVIGMSLLFGGMKIYEYKQLRQIKSSISNQIGESELREEWDKLKGEKDLLKRIEALSVALDRSPRFLELSKEYYSVHGIIEVLNEVLFEVPSISFLGYEWIENASLSSPRRKNRLKISMEVPGLQEGKKLVQEIQSKIKGAKDIQEKPSNKGIRVEFTLY